MYVDKGIDRLNLEWKELYAVRCKMAAELAKIWDGKIIFVPELISKKSIYFEPMCEIHEDYGKCINKM